MRLNLAQLQVIVNDLHSYIECEYLIKFFIVYFTNMIFILFQI